MAQIKFKRGISSNITSIVLLEGEPAFTTDNKKFYIGDSTGGKILINPDVVGSADKLSSAKNFTISGDGTAPAKSFNGTGNVDLAFTLKNIVTAGTSPKITFNAKGQVTGGSALAVTDIPTLTLAKISDAGTVASKNIGIASGNVPILDANGKLPTSTMPAMALVDVFTASSETAMLALSVQQGDVAVRTDVSKNYILK